MASGACRYWRSCWSSWWHGEIVPVLHHAIFNISGHLLGRSEERRIIEYIRHIFLLLFRRGVEIIEIINTFAIGELLHN